MERAPGVPRITTVEAMKLEAERFYEGLMTSWTDHARDDSSMPK